MFSRMIDVQERSLTMSCILYCILFGLTDGVKKHKVLQDMAI